MYEIFYNFRTEPFRLSPDHKFCFEHRSYAKARAYMAYAFKRAEGFVMITGRPGTGKTTLVGELVESLSREKVFTANLVCTQLQADDLLKSVAYSFGVGSARVEKAELLQRLTILFHRWHREGRRALLVVDEAQDLSSSAMEELRLLTNIQLGGQPLLQIFLLGQPELRDLILTAEMEQVHQRIVAASHIEGLEVDESEAYVMHRLKVVGWKGDPAIDRGIFPLIHKFSEGVPRRINLICSRLFLLGSVEQRHAIDVKDVQVVITELQAESLAAGTGFSLDDFDGRREPEWVPAPEVVSQESKHGLHNEKSQQITATEPDAVVESKKKALYSETPVSVPAVETDSIISYDSGANALREGKRPDNLNYKLEVGQPEPPGGENNSTPMQGAAIVARPVWKRAIVLGLLLIVVGFLAFYLKSYFAIERKVSYQLAEPQAASTNEQRSVSVVSDENQSPQSPDSNDKLLNLSPQHIEQLISDEVVSAPSDPAGNENGQSLPVATGAPESQK